jgi:hypothetical protein
MGTAAWSTERYNQIAAYDFTQKNVFGTLGAIYFPGADGPAGICGPLSIAISARAWVQPTG